MITSAGKPVIKKFFARQQPHYATTLAIGVGGSAAALGDAGLEFEVFRTPVTGTFYDPDDDLVIFKAAIPAGQAANVYEVALFYDPDNTDSSRLIPIHSVDGAAWSGGTLVSTNARVGAQTVKVTASASSSQTASITGLEFDLSPYVATDSVGVSFTADANLSSVKLRLGEDSSNYIEFTYGSISAGYNAKRALISSATTTGAPDLSLVNYAAVVATATSGGSTDLYFDGLRFEDNNSDSILVARAVPVSPYAIDTDIPNDFEYPLDIDIP